MRATGCLDADFGLTERTNLCRRSSRSFGLLGKALCLIECLYNEEQTECHEQEADDGGNKCAVSEADIACSLCFFKSGRKCRNYAICSCR